MSFTFWFSPPSSMLPLAAKLLLYIRSKLLLAEEASLFCHLIMLSNSRAWGVHAAR